MPKQLEIRTTILAKKSQPKSREKDANANDVYADEALELLEEIQKLKENIQDTDKRIAGTYKKSLKKIKENTRQKETSKKVSYDVIYPSVDLLSSGSCRRVCESVVSQCLNGVEANYDEKKEERNSDRERCRAAPFLAGATFTSAPTPTTTLPQSPSWGQPAPLPPAASGSSFAEERRNAFRQQDYSGFRRREPQLREGGVPNSRDFLTSRGLHLKGDGERMADYVRSNAPAGISFQRVYAKPTTREDDDDDLGEILRDAGDDGDLSASHDAANHPSAGERESSSINGSGRHASPHQLEAPPQEQRIQEDYTDQKEEETIKTITRANDLIHVNLQADDSMAALTPGNAEAANRIDPTNNGVEEATTQAAIGFVEVKATPGSGDGIRGDTLTSAAVASGEGGRERDRTRHYDRDEIRQFMQRQKKERKEKQLATQKSTSYACNHIRSPSKIPADARSQVKRKKAKETTPQETSLLAATVMLNKDENWGPYESPNFLQALAPSTDSDARNLFKSNQKEFLRQPIRLSRREKSIQTDQEQPSVVQVDEATQMTDDPTEWLHVLPDPSSSRPPTNLRHTDFSMQTSLEHLRTVAVNSSVDKSSNLLQRSSEPPEPTSPVRKAERELKVKSPAQKLVRQIETLEHYIDHMLDAPAFHALTKPQLGVTFQPYSSIGVSKPPLPDSYGRVTTVTPAIGLFQQPAATTTIPPRLTPFRLIDEEDNQRPKPPPRSSSSHRPKLDATTSTLYHDLPDRLNEFLRLGRRSRSDERQKPLPAPPTTDRESHLKYLFRNSGDQLQIKRGANLDADLGFGSLFPPGSSGAGFLDTVEGSTKPKPTAFSTGTITLANRAPEEQPQTTYFRDFNEILQMDRNPLTEERSNSWKRKLPSKHQPSGDQFKLPPSAPYNILSAISDELALTMSRIPARVPLNNTSDSDFLSRISIASETGSERSRDGNSKAKVEGGNQQPKNGQSSRIGTSAESGSRTIIPSAHRENIDASRQEAQENINKPWAELDTTYLTLTPQYTSFEVSNARSAGAEQLADSSTIAEEVETEGENKDSSSIFSTKFSPIPKAVSPLSLVSDSERSGMEGDRKQSTSSSDRSERERSVGDKMVEGSVSRLVTPPRRRLAGRQKNQKPMTSTDKKPGGEDLLARLRSEMQRDEILFRSIQQVDRLEDENQQKSQPFRIQFDPQTRSFFQSQTEALQAIAQDVRSGLGGAGVLTAQPTSVAFLQGSQAAMEIDRAQPKKTSIQSAQFSQEDFLPARSPSSGPSSNGTLATDSLVITDPPSQLHPQKSNKTQRPKRPQNNATAAAVDLSSDSVPLSDSQSSILPPRAVDLLLQEEAKQQRLLLKLREKAQVEKTLAELELLQMQKRILRAQGEREKAASIKKRQRGLLLKLQEERARIEALRRQHKKDEQKSQASSEHHYDSSWETDWSAASNSASVAASIASAVENLETNRDEVPEQYDESNESSTSTLHPTVSEEIPALKGGDELNVIELKETLTETGAIGGGGHLSGLKSEGEGVENASAVSNLRLRAPLSPRTSSADSIRVRMKFRRRHSSGSDDSINLSQNETASDVSDVESRLMALTDQLQRRQSEAQRLKLEHKRISKEKLKAQESALIKQIEVYDRCITDLRTQLDRDVDAEGAPTTSAVVAVRPVIRQPRALIRADEPPKSPTSSARSDTEAKGEHESIKSVSEIDDELSSHSPRKAAEVTSAPVAVVVPIAAAPSSALSSIAIDIQSDADESGERIVASIAESSANESAAAAAETEKSLSELSTDPSSVHDIVDPHDSGRIDPFNQTMIIKSDSQVRDELAEELSRSILDQLVEETIVLAKECLINKSNNNNSVVRPCNVYASRSPTMPSSSSANILQRVNALLSSDAVPKDDRSQLYLTTTFDISSPEEMKSPAALLSAPTSGNECSPCDVASVEGRDALESKLNELRIENEWIDDELQVAPFVSDELGEADENHEKVIKEAQALELEQKRIEQEIQRLSSATGSVLYLREIPNKPPPPYTPPGQALTWSPPSKAKLTSGTESQRIVPKTKEEVSRYCRRFAKFLVDSMIEPKEDDNSCVSITTFPDHLYSVDYAVVDQPSECQSNCRAFMVLLADLTRALLSDLSQRATFLSDRRTHQSSSFSGGRPITSQSDLVDAVEDAVLIHMNYRPRLRREGQLAKWSQKKRDRVDEILVKELQTEEKLWTNFSSEEVQVKRQTADAILDLLLDETVHLYKHILQRSAI